MPLIRERQKALPMTDTLKDAVVKAINEKPANEEHKKLMADVKAAMKLISRAVPRLYLTVREWHALQTHTTEATKSATFL